MKIKFWGPPRPPQKADFGRTKAEMGCFSQKGLCYSFGILHGLLSNKKITECNTDPSLFTHCIEPKIAIVSINQNALAEY